MSSQRLGGISSQEVKELALLTAYKQAVTSAKVDALLDILIKSKLTTYEDFWNRTQDYLRKSSEENVEDFDEGKK